MSYNIKIVEYADGTAQIRFYNGVIRPHRKKSKSIVSVETDKQIIIHATIEELIEMAEKVEEEKKLRAEYSLRSSVSRTRSKIEQLARSGNFTHFVTLTLDPDKTDRFDYSASIKRFTVWMQNIKRVAPDIQALFVPEFHTKNAKIDDEGNKIYAVHFHGLIGNIDGLQLDFYKIRNGQKVYKLKNWNFGISDVTEIDNHDAICKYMRKYVTKQTLGIARIHKSRHRYFKTGLNVPREKKIFINGVVKEDIQNQLIESYAEKYAMTVSGRMNDFSEYGYIPIKCIELKPQ